MQDRKKEIQELHNILAGKPSKLDFKNELTKALAIVNQQLTDKYLSPRSPFWVGVGMQDKYKITYNWARSLFVDQDIQDIENKFMPMDTIIVYIMSEFESKLIKK